MSNATRSRKPVKRRTKSVKRQSRSTPVYEAVGLSESTVPGNVVFKLTTKGAVHVKRKAAKAYWQLFRDYVERRTKAGKDADVAGLRMALVRKKLVQPNTATLKSHAHYDFTHGLVTLYLRGKKITSDQLGKALVKTENDKAEAAKA